MTEDKKKPADTTTNTNANTIDCKKATYRQNVDFIYPHNNEGYVLVENNGLVGVDTDKAREYDGFEIGLPIDPNFLLDSQLKRRLNVTAWYSAEAGPGTNEVTLTRPNIPYSLAKDIERFEEATDKMSEENKRATDNHYLALKTAHVAIYSKEKGPCPSLLKKTTLCFPPKYEISGKELCSNEKKPMKALSNFFTDALWSEVDPADKTTEIPVAETWQWWSCVRLDTPSRIREVPDEEEDEEANKFLKAVRGRS